MDANSDLTIKFDRRYVRSGMTASRVILLHVLRSKPRTTAELWADCCNHAERIVSSLAKYTKRQC